MKRWWGQSFSIVERQCLYGKKRSVFRAQRPHALGYCGRCCSPPSLTTTSAIPTCSHHPSGCDEVASGATHTLDQFLLALPLFITAADLFIGARAKLRNMSICIILIWFSFFTTEWSGWRSSSRGPKSTCTRIWRRANASGIRRLVFLCKFSLPRRRKKKKKYS